MKKLILAAVLLLSGCGLLKPQTQIVEKIVPVKCEASVKPSEPTEYPFDRATKDMSLYEKAKLAMAELAIVRGYNKELKAALNECTK